MSTPSYNTTNTGFRVSDTVLGKSLENSKNGLVVPQTPLQLVGSGPFVLTGDEFASALTTGIIFSGSGSTATVAVTLPSTATILNIMSNSAVNTSITPTFAGTNQTYGMWVSLRLINENIFPGQTVTLVAADAGTGVQQLLGCLNLASATYTISEVLGIDSFFQVLVSQDDTSKLGPAQYLSAVATTPQTPPGTLFVIPFPAIQNQSATTTAFNWNTGTNVLTVQPNVTILVHCVLCMEAIFDGNGAYIYFAPSGQVANPVTGFIGSAAFELSADGSFATIMMTFTYTNRTILPTTWSVYMTNYITPNVAVTTQNGAASMLTIVQVI